MKCVIDQCSNEGTMLVPVQMENLRMTVLVCDSCLGAIKTSGPPRVSDQVDEPRHG